MIESGEMMRKLLGHTRFFRTSQVETYLPNHKTLLVPLALTVFFSKIGWWWFHLIPTTARYRVSTQRRSHPPKVSVRRTLRSRTAASARVEHPRIPRDGDAGKPGGDAMIPKENEFRNTHGCYMVIIWLLYGYYMVIIWLLYIYMVIIWLIIIWLVVDRPIWKIMEWKSVGMMTFPTEWEKKTCSKPPTVGVIIPNIWENKTCSKPPISI